MKNTNPKPTVLLTTLACAITIALIAQGVEAYSRQYRTARDYSRVMSSNRFHHRNYRTPELYSRTRGHHGTLSESNVHAFREEFVNGQSAKGLYSALGYPNQSRGNQDIWMIQRTGIDGRPSGQYGRFIAEYRSDGRSNTRAEW